MIEKLTKGAALILLSALAGTAALRAEIGISGCTDHETVDWLAAKTYDAVPRKGTEMEKKAALAEFKKLSFWKILPLHVKKAVEDNQSDYDVDEYSSLFVYNSKISVYYAKHKGECYVRPRMWSHLTFVDAPEESPAMNPETNKYYVMPARQTLVGLSPEDLIYVKKLTEAVNRNIHYLGNSPIPQLNLQKMKTGGYLLCAVMPPQLASLKVAFSSRVRERVYKDRSPQEIMALYSLSDDTELNIAMRLGVPLYHPERLNPELSLSGPRGNQNAYRGLPIGEDSQHPGKVIFLGWSRFISKDKEQQADAYMLLYNEYFSTVTESVLFFRKGLQEELASVPAADARRAAVSDIVAQADKIAARIAAIANAYAERGGGFYRNPPKTLLDPKGRYFARVLKQYKAAAEAQRSRVAETPSAVAASHTVAASVSSVEEVSQPENEENDSAREKMENYDWKAGFESSIEVTREQNRRQKSYEERFGSFKNYVKHLASNGATGIGSGNSEEITDPVKKREVLEKLKSKLGYDKLPAVWRQLIDENFENVYICATTELKSYDAGGNVINTVKYDPPLYYAELFRSRSLRVFIRRNILYADIEQVDAVAEWLNELRRTPAINPETKQPYVQIAPEDLRYLSLNEEKYAKALCEVVNENIHFMGSTPFPRIDLEKARRGVYFGKGFFAPVLLWLDDPGQNTVDRYWEKKWEQIDQIKKHFFEKDELDKRDEEKFKVMMRLGISLYNPHLAFPPEKIRMSVQRYCDGVGNCQLGLPAFGGTQMASVSIFSEVASDSTVARMVNNDLEDVRKSIKKFRGRLEEEVERFEPGSPRHRLVRKIADSAKPYLDKMDAFCDSYMELCGYGKNRNLKFAANNIPYTLLDPRIDILPPIFADAGQKEENAEQIDFVPPSTDCVVDESDVKKSAAEKRQEREIKKKRERDLEKKRKQNWKRGKKN